jgi:hypothetical protein
MQRAQEKVAQAKTALESAEQGLKSGPDAADSAKLKAEVDHAGTTLQIANEAASHWQKESARVAAKVNTFSLSSDKRAASAPPSTTTKLERQLLNPRLAAFAARYEIADGEWQLLKSEQMLTSSPDSVSAKNEVERARVVLKVAKEKGTYWSNEVTRIEAKLKEEIQTDQDEYEKAKLLKAKGP